MRTYILGSILTLLLCSACYGADVSVQKVSEEPLQGGVSFNTITFALGAGLDGWVTAPSVEMRGRKGVFITNGSTTDDIYLTGVSGSSVMGTLYPRERAFINAASSNHIYVSSNSVTTVEVWEIR